MVNCDTNPCLFPKAISFSLIGLLVATEFHLGIKLANLLVIFAGSDSSIVCISSFTSFIRI
ncbi:hypothetical protein BC833DRAFT_580808 [Globomyces pollinis-pini]|nr:hypothetical protein BC833DRAFT_580808 [Globomyces pollinis-pini]